jgi:hypothetical protein
LYKVSIYNFTNKKEFKNVRLKEILIMASFLDAAKRPMVDVTSFLKANAGGSLKYSAVANEVHKLYFPYNEVQTENGIVRGPVALQAMVHDIHVTPEKFESCVCLSGVTRVGADGEVINDGTCPFCDRYGDAWNIKDYREKLALEGTTKTGKDLDDYKRALSSQYGSEIKVSKAKPKAYVLVAKFNCDAQGNPQIENGLPTYELKVMSLTTRRLEDFNTMFIQSGMNLAGGELSIKYPNIKDPRQLVGQSVSLPAFGAASITQAYPNVVAKIQADVANFNWEGLETSFPEWKGMSTQQATIKCNSMFHAWDSYVQEKAVNPSARYLEYDNASATNPALSITQQAQPEVAQTAQQVAPQAQQAQIPNGMAMGMGGMNGFAQAQPQTQATTDAGQAQQANAGMGGFGNFGMGDMGAMFGQMNGPKL